MDVRNSTKQEGLKYYGESGNSIIKGHRNNWRSEKLQENFSRYFKHAKILKYTLVIFQSSWKKKKLKQYRDNNDNNTPLRKRDWSNFQNWEKCVFTDH